MADRPAIAALQNLNELKVAVMPRIDWLPVSAEILTALDTLASRLSRAGASLRVAAPPLLGDMCGADHAADRFSTYRLALATRREWTGHPRRHRRCSASVRRPAGVSGARHAEWPAGHRLSRGPVEARRADRAAGHRAIPRRPHADSLCGTGEIGRAHV